MFRICRYNGTILCVFIFPNKPKTIIINYQINLYHWNVTINKVTCFWPKCWDWIVSHVCMLIFWIKSTCALQIFGSLQFLNNAKCSLWKLTCCLCGLYFQIVSNQIFKNIFHVPSSLWELVSSRGFIICKRLQASKNLAI